MTFSANFSLVLPEVVLAIAALVLLVAGAFRGKVGGIFTLAAVASLVAAAAGWALVLAKDTHGSTIRLAPPIVVEADELRWAAGQLADALASFG